MRCCDNCEWCISPEEEDEIMEEQGYNDGDINRPQAGDCAIGMIHNANYVCDKHYYKDGMEEYKTYCLYDEEYLGEGYFIIQKLDDDIVKFVKISKINSCGFPHFFISAYENDSYYINTQKFKTIEFSIDKSENIELYECFHKLTLLLGKQKVFSVDSLNYGKNHLRLSNCGNIVSLELFKDVYGSKNATDYINIDIGDNDTCAQYNQFFDFYKNLANVIEKEKDEGLIKQLIKK